jgi:hypothetical protein
MYLQPELGIRIRRILMFWASRIRIRIHQSEIKIRVLPFSEIMLAKKDFNTKFYQKI